MVGNAHCGGGGGGGHDQREVNPMDNPTKSQLSCHVSFDSPLGPETLSLGFL